MKKLQAFNSGSGNSYKIYTVCVELILKKVSAPITVAGPEPLIEKLARNDVIKARWIGVEVIFGLVLCQAILCLRTYWS